MVNFDHILLIGFGGPESREEVMPFLKQVTAGKEIPEARLRAVAHHYELIGGKSPYNAWANRLQKDLASLVGKELPVFLGYRSTAPFLKEVLLDIHDRGFKKGVGVILAPFRSTASCRRYKENIHEALHQNGIMDLSYSYLPAWYNHVDWIKILSNLVAEEITKIPIDIRQQAEVLFSCHSIPEMADKACSSCIYSAEYEAACRLVAEQVGSVEWKHVYQSRSASASTTQRAWLEPDILETIKAAAAVGKKAVIVIPMGFLSDNAEVLYDLDIETKKLAEDLGQQFYRVPTPGNQSVLVELFADLICEVLKSGRNKNSCVV